METRITPGDWTCFNNGNDDFNEIGVLSDAPESDNGTFITSAKIYNEDGKEKYAEAIANAKLIASAPELLEALKGVMEYNQGYSNLSLETHRKAKEAIKKATE